MKPFVDPSVVDPAPFEKLGAFYLGRLYDGAAGKPSDAPLLYDSKDLTTHAVCVGMTGSGKTGLCLSLLEEATIDGLPAIAIDPKGDIGNLLLNFPALEPADFEPWIDPGEAARKGRSPAEQAESVAQLWRKGLADWGEDGRRVARLREAAEVRIYTPGSSAGLPVSVLSSFAAPADALRADAEAFNDRVSAAVSGLLSLIGVEADPLRSREHILLASILSHHWKEGRDLDVGRLIREVQKPPFDKVGVLDLESVYPAKERFELSTMLNGLLASPGFAAWMEGAPLDIGRMLWDEQGKPRIAIFSIAHLSDPERMFFVTLLLTEILGWVRAQSGTTSLRALLYMDEVFGYLPPVANPPSKLPLLTLLKQARAFGLGVVLATQNPVDLDYKGLSNTGTWLIGRLQTERDKLRVLDGLEGAAASAGATFDRAALDRVLSGLSSRVFLMNNVHEDAPVLFHTRWALSYLRGPLTREEIRLLTAERAEPSAKSAAPAEKAASTAAAAASKPAAPESVA
ncbi:MAG: ATP-binding protein, partial [Kiloniellales bacterium]